MNTVNIKYTMNDIEAHETLIVPDDLEVTQKSAAQLFYIKMSSFVREGWLNTLFKDLISGEINWHEDTNSFSIEYKASHQSGDFVYENISIEEEEE